MTDENAGDFATLVRAVQLKDVRLKEATVRTLVRNLKTIDEPQLVVNHGAGLIGRTEHGFLIGASVTLHLVKRGENPTEQSPVYINVVFALTYDVANPERFSDSDLGQFAEANGTFNAWPYFREYIQSTAARMNFPTLVLPVFRIQLPAAPAPVEKSAAVQAPQASRPSRKGILPRQKLLAPVAPRKK